MFFIAGALEFPWYFVLLMLIVLILAIIIFLQVFLLPVSIISLDFLKSRNKPETRRITSVSFAIAAINILLGDIFLFQAKTNIDNSVEFHEGGEAYILAGIAMSLLFLLTRYTQQRQRTGFNSRKI